MTQEIALFVTCMVDQMFPEVGVAATKLLSRYGFEVVFPTRQTCCGQPFSNSGFIPESKRLARQTLEIFDPYDALIVLGGSCTGMVRKEYPQLFRDEPTWQSKAEGVSAKVFEFSEFLSSHAALEPKRNANLTVTYHDSCHMLRMIGIRDQPRQLLEQVGCEIYEMEESDRCCGFGGLFSVRMREISQAMTGYKLRQARETKAGVLVTSDPGCLMQMRAHQNQGNAFRVEHLAVLLEEMAK